MTPFTIKQMIEANVLLGGNGYIWIIRNRLSLQPEELIPVPYKLVIPHRESNGVVWYQVQNPMTGEPFIIMSDDMIHLKGFSHDGLIGLSVLSRAREVIAAGRRRNIKLLSMRMAPSQAASCRLIQILADMLMCRLWMAR